MIYARIADGIVAELIEIPAGGAPLVNRFHPSVVASCVAASGGAAVGWLYADGAFSPPPGPTLAAVRTAAAQAVRAQFDARIAAGMPWSGTRLQIDTDSRTNLLGAKGLADDDALPAPFGWRMSNNSTLPLDVAGVQAMATAAGLYYAVLFARRVALGDAVEAASTAAAIQAIDVTTGWPA